MKKPYNPKNNIRIVTAASLFDGHDAAINVMRRILQSSGVEVIHLGHDRSVQQIVNTAIQENAQAIAITSYQGGHIEFFKYAYDLLRDNGAPQIKLFGGGGGTILPEELDELHSYGIDRLYSPDDGRAMGLQGMINDLLEQADFRTGELGDDMALWVNRAIGNASRPVGHIATLTKQIDALALGKVISAVENGALSSADIPTPHLSNTPILGVTGTGGAGKSSLVDELVRRFLLDFPDKQLAIVSVDPTKRRTGGALLGDRIRMNSVYNERVYMRSVATRQSNLAVSQSLPTVIELLKAAPFDLVILETSGIGQSDTAIVDLSDVSLYVMTPEFGAASQLEKIDMLDFADVVAINKFDKRGAQDALRDVKKQIQRNRGLWDADADDIKAFGTIASQFNDPGTNQLYRAVMQTIAEATNSALRSNLDLSGGDSEKIYIIPPRRVRYLSEIAETIRAYDERVLDQARIANERQSLLKAAELIQNNQSLNTLAQNKQEELDKASLDILRSWDELQRRYREETFTYQVRGRDIRVETHTTSLSGNQIPRIGVPKFSADGDKLRWAMQENYPGYFPFTAGVYPFKRSAEDPTRMFAGEGSPERTNRRFHYVSLGMPAKRLSTAFDSVTLYGNDPAPRPDIYGKVGNSGVSIPTLDDAKKLYSGFNLCDRNTSVSMTINGPAATILAFFLNAAIDQQCELYIRANGLEAQVETILRGKYDETGTARPRYHGELPKGNDGLGLLLLGVTGDEVLSADIYERIKAETLSKVRGTVQADILKEDQAQNTCIFSTEFSLRIMGDVQQYFIDHNVRNFYSVSISGYHMAEAGANPISQLAFTLANGFTFLEYYASRGMDIDKFAPNFSFFFSNGLDAEYAVIGRVARRIWAKALKLKYGTGERAQKLKYHIQTSGRSLHAQEIGFNDIRTTLQALYAIYDNTNSLHTNAYDEAITTPTEESVRRAMAIQLIINRELGLAKNENPMQGSFIIEELTDLVEEAVLREFDRLTERGGVLGAMETMYQRSKIQQESLYYERLKHSGDMPIIGVNTFLSADGSPTVTPNEVIRATDAEKQRQITNLHVFQDVNEEKSQAQLAQLQQLAVQNENLFDGLIETVKVSSLGQITDALFEVGGQYRRNM